MARQQPRQLPANYLNSTARAGCHGCVAAGATGAAVPCRARQSALSLRAKRPGNQVTLGYSFGELVHKGSNLNLTVSAQNLFLITKYKGLDPEIVKLFRKSRERSCFDKRTPDEA